MRTLANREILVTKLGFGSLRSGLVPRPRLARRFDHAPFNGLTLVCAQAGYGKTTLVSSWLQGGADQAAWLSLDRDDNDPVRFLAHLVASVRTLEEAFRPDLLRLLQSPNPPPIATLMTGFVNAVAALAQRLIVVLDDYHLIADQAVHDAVQFLLAHQPANLHIIIASREEPPFSLARLHSHGRLVRFSESDLCFTAPEAEEFFNRVMQLSLSQHQSDTLRGHTEGWAAGLQMAALSLARSDSTDGFIAGFSGTERHVIDFLVDEVLSHQTATVQSFLMRTSILDRFNAELCQALTGEPDCQAMLTQLERNHMFLIPLDANRQWYRYHHLFADLLQSRLARAQADQLPALHGTAARWYAGRALAADALRHARSAGDMDLIAAILDRQAIAMFTRGEVRTVAAWLSLLPVDVALQYPRVALLAAFNIYFQAIPDAALAGRFLSAIDRVLATAQDHRDLAGKAAVVRGYQARFAGRAELALECFSMAVAQLPHSDLFHAIAQINLAILHAVLGRLELAAEILRDYADVSDAQPHLWISMTGIFGLARIAFVGGDLAAARQICDDGLDQFARRGLQDTPVCSMLHLQLAEIAFVQDRLEDAVAQATRVRALAQAGGMELNLGCSAVLLARIACVRGDAGGLEVREEQRMLGFWAQAGLIIPPLSGWLAQLWFAQGRVRELTEWFAQRGIDPETCGPEWETEGLVLARLLLQQQRAPEAFKLLARLLQNAEHDRRHGAVLDIMVLQVLVRLAEDKHKAAGALTLQALALAQKQGHLRPFRDAGAAMQALLAGLDVPAALQAFSARVLEAFAGSVQAQASGTLLPALSGKEEKVARLLVAGLSNEEIADRLFVSPNTVKFHIKGLYRKLGVSKRFDAIQKIRG